jgi:hypothetical protein
MQGIIVDLLSYSHWHIDVHVQGGLYEQRWHGTFVYGEPKASEHHQMWTLLRQIRPLSSEPWMMTGDFNEAMWQGEHFSHTRRSERLMRDFREVLSDCDLHDLGFARTPWTFDNHQQGEKNVGDHSHAETRCFAGVEQRVPAGSCQPYPVVTIGPHTPPAGSGGSIRGKA